MIWRHLSRSAPFFSCKLCYKCLHSLFIRCHIIVLVTPYSRWLCIAMLNCWNTSWFWGSLILLSWTICLIFWLIWLAAKVVCFSNWNLFSPVLYSYIEHVHRFNHPIVNEIDIQKFSLTFCFKTSCYWVQGNNTQSIARGRPNTEPSQIFCRAQHKVYWSFARLCCQCCVWLHNNK